MQKIDIDLIKNSRFTNWFWFIHLSKNKKDLLRIAMEDEPYVPSMLYYCYNNSFSYGITPIRISSDDRVDARGKPAESDYYGRRLKAVYPEFTAILDKVLNGDISRKEATTQLYNLYVQCDRYTRWVFNRVLDRDLKIGVTATSIKRMFPDLFESPLLIQRPKVIYSLEEVPQDQYPLYAVPFNFNTRTFIVSEKKYFKFLTFNGASRLINYTFNATLPRNIVLDGYFSWIDKPVGTKLKKKKDRKKYRFVTVYEKIPVYHCVDYIPLSEFYGECELPLIERKKLLKSLNIWSDSILLEQETFIAGKEALPETSEQNFFIRGVNSKWGVDLTFNLRLS